MKEIYAIENGRLISINQPGPSAIFVLLGNNKEKVEIIFDCPIQVNYSKGSSISKVIQSENSCQFLDENNLVVLEVNAKSVRLSRP